MKTKEQLANEYALENFKEFGGSGRLEIANKSFIAGYKAAQPKWVKVEDELPPVGKLVLAIKKGHYKNYQTIKRFGFNDDMVFVEQFYHDYITSFTHWCDCLDPKL